jgi:hypothetical protein
MSGREIDRDRALMWLNVSRRTDVRVRLEVKSIDVLDITAALRHWTKDLEITELVARDPAPEELSGAYQLGAGDGFLEIGEPALPVRFRLRPHPEWGPVGDPVQVPGQEPVVGAVRRPEAQLDDELVIELGGDAELIISRSRSISGGDA